MSLLKSEPTGTVKSLEELFAIAAAMEQEAADRYAEIADRMREEGSLALADVFARLSEDERGHLDNVVHWSQRTKGQAPDPARIRWEPPETFDDEGLAAGDPRLLSAYRALAMAVRNEERAFAFWSYVAAHAESPEIRQAAETMAHEELGHVSVLRRERRKAFHAERMKSGPVATELDGPAIAALERQLADLLESLIAKAPSDVHVRLVDLAAEARRNAEELEQADITGSGVRLVSQDASDPIVLSELLTEIYLQAGDNLRDEQALDLMQAMAARAIGRLAWLRADLPELQGA